jgi:hypothetical protein
LEKDSDVPEIVRVLDAADNTAATARCFPPAWIRFPGNPPTSSAAWNKCNRRAKGITWN